MSILSKKNKTPFLKKEEIIRNWFVVDASGKNLGRLSTVIASRLRGKHNPKFTPNQLCGDNIIVINASKVEISGSKRDDKEYHHHSLYPGGLTTIAFKDLLKKYPERIILSAVKGMLPKSRLGNAMLKNCRVFAGETHNLKSQKPTRLEI